MRNNSFQLVTKLNMVFVQVQLFQRILIDFIQLIKSKVVHGHRDYIDVKPVNGIVHIQVTRSHSNWLLVLKEHL